ncbi:GAF domain-containing protein [Gracilimonas sediminicola]|uniref:histidine kinase n=1 Tax=Gracilimonas sediminicola TaxID=2952158 RepID=A0A9X2L2G5_9BACT|nr:GAF domain-containing protein [Gracilimonas sediminicola]
MIIIGGNMGKEVTSELLQQREAELAVINNVQKALLEQKDMQHIYEMVGEHIRDLFDAQVAVISTFNLETGTEHFHYAFEDGERHDLKPRPIDKLRQRLIDTQELICINENADDVWTELTGEEPSVAPGTKLTKSALWVPMVSGKTTFGYLSLQNVDREHAFSDDDIQLLSTLANSLGIALESARLFNETEQRNAELAVINSVQQGLVAEMDLQGIYDLVGDKIRDLFDSQVTVIAEFDTDSKLEHFHYVFEDGKRFYPDSRKYDGVREALISTKELIHINENASERIKEYGASGEAAPGTKFPKSMVYVPLILGDAVRGYVSLQNLDREFAFNDSDVRLLSTLANSMSVALENARLFNETEQRNAELAVINSVQQGLVAEMDMQGIYDLVGEKVRVLFDAQGVIIGTFNHETEQEHFQYAFENGERVEPAPRPYDKIRRRLISTQKLIHIAENAKEAYTTITGEAPRAVPGTTFPKSMLYVPLKVGNSVRGYVSLQNIDKEHAFSESDVRLLSTLANSMSVALENARLFNETEQRNAELAVINSVQQGLVAEMDMQGIYDLVGNRIHELFDAQVTGIVTFNHEAKTEDWKYAFEDGARMYPKVRAYDKIREKIIKEKTILNIEENAAEILSEIKGEIIKPVPGTRLAKSALYVPMIVSDEVRGYLTLQNNDREHAFSDSDVRLLSTLANSMSVALENARLFNETEQRNAELAVINSVQQGLVAEMDMQGIYDLVGSRIRDLFDAQVTGVVTFNHEVKKELFKYVFEDGERLYPKSRLYDRLRAKIIEDKSTLLINENAAAEMARINKKPFKPVPGTRLAKSAVYVPMIVGDTVRGYVTLQNLDRENAFSSSDVSLLTTLVNSMTVALENARLFNETNRLLAETEQRNAELAVINSVQEGLVREMDMQAIYSLVGNRICEVLNTQTMLIRTFDHDKEIETWEYAVENGERLYLEPRPFIWANKHLIKTKEALLINEDYVETAKKYGDTDHGVSKGLPPKAAIFVPMIVGDKVMGSISLQNVEKEHAFTESDVRLLTTLTNSMSVALENARLFNETTRLLGETEQRAAELQTVNSISKAIVSQLEVDALFKLVGEKMRETFKADIVYLAIHDKKSDLLHFPYYYGDKSESRPFGNGITEKIITSKEPLLVNHDLDETYDKIKAEKKGEMVESYLGVPILAGKKSLGVISVQSKEQENRFSETDLRLLSTIAANVGIAIQNAEAYQKLQSALNELRAAQEQLVQQEKLASLGQLTAGIAHEIKNPLNFVNNFSELSVELIEETKEELSALSDQLSAEDKGRILGAHEILKDIDMNLRKIHEHGSRADSIVKSMLEHSRGGSGKMEPTDLNALVKEFVNLSFHGMRASKNPINVAMDFELDDSVGEVPLIAEDFSRVIVNLCNNAFDAMREKLNSNDQAPNSKDYRAKLIVRTSLENGRILLQIEDNGPGIPEEMKSKIMQPFFTTKKGTEGTGLGLSITNDVIKAHGGELDLSTIPGNGTTFSIKIPQA